LNDIVKRKIIKSFMLLNNLKSGKEVDVQDNGGVLTLTYRCQEFEVEYKDNVYVFTEV
jgi:hypothetical protein